MSAVVVPIVPAIQLERILYSTDLSSAARAALPIVSTIARNFKSQVYVAYVWAPLPYTMVTPEAASTLETRQERDARREVERIGQSRELKAVPVTSLVASGDAGTELKRMVRENHIDLAVLSTHGRTGLKHLMMGSVAEDLFRNLPCPVLTVGPHLAPRFQTLTGLKEILFPTDMSEESKAVFPYLASLAAEYQAHITVLHVLPLQTASNPDAKRLAAPLQKEMEHAFAPMLSPRTPVSYLIDFGDPAERILTHALTSSADLIGMGVRQAGEITTHFRTTAAYKVVVGAYCPVLTAHYGD